MSDVISLGSGSPTRGRSPGPPKVDDRTPKKSDRKRSGSRSRSPRRHSRYGHDEASSSRSIKYNREGKPIPSYFKEPAMTYHEMRVALNTANYNVKNLAKQKDSLNNEIDDLKKKIYNKEDQARADLYEKSKKIKRLENKIDEKNETIKNLKQQLDDRPARTIIATDDTEKGKRIKKLEEKIDRKDEKIEHLNAELLKERHRTKYAKDEIRNLQQGKNELLMKNFSGEGSKFDKNKNSYIATLEQDNVSQRQLAYERYDFEKLYLDTKAENERVLKENDDLRKEFRTRYPNDKRVGNYDIPKIVDDRDKKLTALRADCNEYKARMIMLEARAAFEADSGKAKMEDMLEGIDKKRIARRERIEEEDLKNFGKKARRSSDTE